MDSDEVLLEAERGEEGDVALGVEFFDDCLDHQIAIHQFAERMCRLDVGERGERACVVQLALGREFGERVGEVVACGSDGSRIGVVKAHGEPGERRDLCNAAAHCATAHNADSFDAAKARGHFGCSTPWLF